MKDYLMIDIANRINAIAKSDSVKALANMSPRPLRSQPHAMRCWDMELTHSNFKYVERFNNGMAIKDKDIDVIVVNLLRTLFSDYYDAKCLASPLKEG